MKAKNKIILAVSFLVASILAGASYWFVQRLAVGTWRHALNAQVNEQEAKQDPFSTVKRELCKNADSGRIRIEYKDPRYKMNPRATSSLVYRYIPLESVVLKHPLCLAAFLDTAATVDYPTSLVFIDKNGFIVADFYFFPRSKS